MSKKMLGARVIFVELAFLDTLNTLTLPGQDSKQLAADNAVDSIMKIQQPELLLIFLRGDALLFLEGSAAVRCSCA